MGRRAGGGPIRKGEYDRPGTTRLGVKWPAVYAKRAMHRQRVIDLLLAENRTVLAGNIVIMRRSERQEMWSGVARDVTQPMVMRLKATELLGKAQADFVEVRTPPVVTEQHG